MLIFVILNVFMLSVVTLSVVAPYKYSKEQKKTLKGQTA
jgi:hypothetical protein